MPTFIALLRGINIGGTHPLPMKELVAILEALGCTNVATYIQSGNAVFKCQVGLAAQLAEKISREVGRRRGFEPSVILLTLKELEQAMRRNPFPEAEADPTRLAVGFLGKAPQKPDLAGLEALRLKSERFAVVERCFYLYAPNGFGKSKLASRAEKLLGVPMTARNWRTVGKIREMAETV